MNCGLHFAVFDQWMMVMASWIMLKAKKFCSFQSTVKYSCGIMLRKNIAREEIEKLNEIKTKINMIKVKLMQMLLLLLLLLLLEMLLLLLPLMKLLAKEIP